VLSSVRRLIDQIEVHRLPQLPETPQVLGQGVNMGGTSADAEVKDLFAGVSGGGGQDLFSSTPAPSKDGDLFAFLGGGGAPHGSSATTSADPFGGSGGTPAPSSSGMGDMFGSQSRPAADPFAGSMGNSTSNQPKLGGWDDDPIASSFGSFGNQPPKQQPSNTFGQSSQPFGGQSSQPFGGSSSSAFGQQPDPFKQADPFQSQQRQDPFGGLSKGPGTSSGLDLNNMSQKKKSSNMDIFGSSNSNASKPDPFAGVSTGMGMGQPSQSQPSASFQPQAPMMGQAHSGSSLQGGMNSMSLNGNSGNADPFSGLGGLGGGQPNPQGSGYGMNPNS